MQAIKKLAKDFTQLKTLLCSSEASKKEKPGMNTARVGLKSINEESMMSKANAIISDYKHYKGGFNVSAAGKMSKKEIIVRKRASSSSSQSSSSDSSESVKSVVF